MQVLKEELRTLILKKAEQEFLQKKFEHASLRNIAKESGTTIGNIYRYFSNKEALFDELVKNEYNAFLYLMEHHENEEMLDINHQNDNSINWRDYFQTYLTKFMPIFTKRFLLLIDRSENTQYQSARSIVLKTLEQHSDKHFTEYGISTTPGFTRILAEQILAGLLFIIETCDDNERKQQLISDMFAFFIEGTLHFS
ncbi:TetR/AcrR family transcriptional regulator [Paenibacillus sp. BAC0078]